VIRSSSPHLHLDPDGPELLGRPRGETGRWLVGGRLVDEIPGAGNGLGDDGSPLSRIAGTGEHERLESDGLGLAEVAVEAIPAEQKPEGDEIGGACDVHLVQGGDDRRIPTGDLRRVRRGTAQRLGIHLVAEPHERHAPVGEGSRARHHGDLPRLSGELPPGQVRFEPVAERRRHPVGARSPDELVHDRDGKEIAAPFGHRGAGPQIHHHCSSDRLGVQEASAARAAMYR
jgi:hypothetical protein